MRATAIAQPNIALIKYWGKRDSDRNLPAVGSLSVTLGSIGTRTTVEFDAALDSDRVHINEQEVESVDRRVEKCLDRFREKAAIAHKAVVTTANDFPTGAGLASSASGFAALVVAADRALDLNLGEDELVDIARTGSGSAPRSLYGGFVLLENDSDDGIRCGSVLGPETWPWSIIIAVTSEAPKKVSSTDGMELSRTTSPYFSRWVETHDADLRAAVASIEDRDFEKLGELAERSCLKMHAVAMTSRPPLLYWSGATLECAQNIRELRKSGVPVFFSIDAGPQLKAFCLPDNSEEVRDSLESVPGVLRVISSELGEGARIVE